MRCQPLASWPLSPVCGVVDVRYVRDQSWSEPQVPPHRPSAHRWEGASSCPRRTQCGLGWAGGEDGLDSTALLCLYTRDLVLPALESILELRLGPPLPGPRCAFCIGLCTPNLEGPYEAFPTQPTGPQGEREMAAASEVISGKEPRRGGLGSQRSSLSALCMVVCTTQPDWLWSTEGLSVV